MPQLQNQLDADDFVTSVVDTVSRVIKLSNPQREKIDATLRNEWGGFPVYVPQRPPSLRQAIRDASGTYDEIARKFRVSRVTVWRYRKGR